MKKLVALLIILTFVFSLCGCSEKQYDANNIFKLYNKEWIVGKSREEIQDKYGKFNSEFVSDQGENLGAYYVNWDKGWAFGLPPSNIHDTYFVVFDDNDIARDAYFAKTSAGG